MARGTTGLTNWQRRCVAQLKASANHQPETLRLLAAGTVDEENGTLHVPFALTTSEIETVPAGLPLQDEEAFILAIGPSDERPPTVYVDHFRFLGHPHVLAGFQFCLYLDESREWDPEQGINGVPNGVLNRLWRWLIKAAKAQFNPNEALYHAVGGIPHLSRTGIPLPPIVVRDLPPQRGRVVSAWLTSRTDWCLQLNGTRPDTDHVEHMPVFFTDEDLPFGAGRDYLYELTVRLDLQESDEGVDAFTVEHSGLRDDSQAARSKCLDCPFPYTHSRVVTQVDHNSQSVAMLTALAASASRKPPGTPQTLLLAVPHPIGGPRHLIAVYFEAALADHLRHIVATRTGPILTFDKVRLDRATPLKWCYVSDERREVTKRRDMGRPVIAYQGKNVLIWGVGGLGSWMAEYITRAGAEKVTVCDNGIVTGGLLVRQNYADLDIGASKADRLAERLRAVTSETCIESRHNFDDDELQALATTADLIVDATINRVVTRRLETITNRTDRRAVIAQVANDARTGCLGIAMVYGPQQPASILEADAYTGRVVEAEPNLEPYQVFWKDPEPGDEFVPTRGCSLPTFHGSAADLAAVAAILTNLIAPHLGDLASGTHLFALPHSGVTPSYRYLKHRDAPTGTT
jgi:ThiF family/Prokaryotic E2 family A